MKKDNLCKISYLQITHCRINNKEQFPKHTDFMDCSKYTDNIFHSVLSNTISFSMIPTAHL